MNPPLKWHGGKHYLASRLWELAAPILDSVVHVGEPYCGGASFVLEGLARGYKKSFWVNDLDAQLINFWRVLQDERLFGVFLRQVQATPFSEIEWLTARHVCDWPETEAAARFFVRCRQSLAGRMKQFSPLSRTRTRRGMNEQCSAWLSAVEGLPQIHALLARVAILASLDGAEVIKQQDGPQTLFYVDPPYLWETRSQHRNGGEVSDYAHEMTQEQHHELLTVLGHISGKFMLSGYLNELYEAHARTLHWKRHDFDLPNNAAGGAQKRRMTECVWTNF